MRIVWGIVLWFVATLTGVIGAGWFSLAGLYWSGGFTTRYYWEEGEGEIGVGFAVVTLIGWALLLWAMVAVMRGGRLRESRGARVAAIILVVLSVIIVVTLCVVALVWPEPPSEFPSPPWNRA